MRRNPTAIFHVDSFTAQPYTGNPAGVCLLSESADAAWMQAVAREMNLPATAFVYPIDDGFDLRWFTASAELTLCGHATLASAHVLFETSRIGLNEIARFHTKSGLLTAVRNGDWIELNFPATPEERAEAPVGLADALGISPVYVGKSRLDYLVEVESEKTVRALRPDFARLREVPARGVIVTSRSSSADFDFVSRFFAPSVGIDEDPATGSSHCCLAPFWSSRFGNNRLIARQLSERGGVLKVEVEGDRVRLSGQAVTVLRGELLAR